jgi:uncharacterized protein
MIWVGGGIILHGLETYGLDAAERIIHDVAEAATDMPWSATATGWLLTAVGSGMVGLLVGATLIPMTQFVIAPAWTTLMGLVRAG